MGACLSGWRSCIDWNRKKIKPPPSSSPSLSHHRRRSKGWARKLSFAGSRRKHRRDGEGHLGVLVNGHELSEGSRDEIWFDTNTIMESDCDEDFHSIQNDSWSVRGSSFSSTSSQKYSEEAGNILSMDQRLDQDLENVTMDQRQDQDLENVKMDRRQDQDLENVKSEEEGRINSNHGLENVKMDQCEDQGQENVKSEEENRINANGNVENYSHPMASTSVVHSNDEGKFPTNEGFGVSMSENVLHVELKDIPTRGTSRSLDLRPINSSKDERPRHSF